MVYDASQPTNTTKIRNLGVVLRPNWQAIEQADATFRPYAVNLANRTPLAVPGNPAAIADTIILYSRQDASGNPQLFAIDPASRITQMSVSVAPVSGFNGYTWLAGGMLLQWGQGHATGATSTQITFPVAFSATAYNVQLTLYRSAGGTMDSIYVRRDGGHVPSATTFEVYNPNGGHDFFWTAIGPKV